MLFKGYFNDTKTLRGIKMIFIKSNQVGATMMEALGVLTILILLGISSIRLIGNIYNMFRQSLVVNEVRDLQKVISDRYKFEGNYKELFEGKTPEETAKFLCDEKMAPFQMCSDGLLYHRMGGKVWVMPVENVDSDGNSYNDYSKYALSFWKMTDRTCLNAAQINWNTQQKSDVYKMIINSGTSKELVVDLPYNKQDGSVLFPVLPDQIIKACDNDDDNQIEWVFF